jgi:hypothetical protein
MAIPLEISVVGVNSGVTGQAAGEAVVHEQRPMSPKLQGPEVSAD